MLRRLFLVALALSLTTGLALAAGRAPSPEELASLERDAAAFAKATERNKVKAIIDALPSRVITTVATSAGLAPDQVRKMLADQAKAFGKSAKAKDVTADLSNVTIREGQRGSIIVTWTVLPMTGTTLSGGQRVPFTAKTVAILEKGTWHFARIDAAGQAEMIEGAYPEIKGLAKAN